MRHRLKPIAALIPFGLLLGASAPEPRKPVELQRYNGRWYEVARLHNRIEDACIDAQADYTPQPDGGYKVTQTCVHASGPPKLYHASMKILDPGTNAKFRLTFFAFLHEDYWVLDYSPGQWVVLGDPKGKYLWLFSRRQNLQLDKATLVARAKALGYDTGKLIYDR